MSWNAKISGCVSLWLVSVVCVSAQQMIIPLWDNVPAGSENWSHPESFFVNAANDRIIRNVSRPDLSVFLPGKDLAIGTAVVIAPGGAFRILSYDNEGTKVAEWFRNRGVVAFLLKYRVQNVAPPTSPPVSRPPNRGTFAASLAANSELTAVSLLAIEDGKRAMEIVRGRANEFGISPDKIGFVGFSAGGLVALHTALTDNKHLRPNFLGLIYTSANQFTIPNDVPPMFALVAADDEVVGNGSLLEYQTWRAAGCPAEIHIYEKGGHGFGMKKQDLPIDTWIDRLGDWLKSLGYL